MKLTISKQSENPILKRTEIEADLVFTGPTPSKDTVKNEIASQTKASADLVEIKEINTTFGHQFAKARVYVYKDVESKKEMVELNKKQIEKAKKAKEAPKEEKPAEKPKNAPKPAAEKKEEPKPEEKKE